MDEDADVNIENSPKIKLTDDTDGCEIMIRDNNPNPAGLTKDELEELEMMRTGQSFYDGDSLNLSDQKYS